MPEPIVPPVTANPARPGTETELVRVLADTLGAEVENTMNQIGWSENTPLPIPQADPATATPSATTQANPASEAATAGDQTSTQPTGGTTPAIDWDTLRDANGLIAGKWKDPAAATQGIHNLIQYAKTALTERDQYKQRTSTLEAQLRQPVPPAPAVQPVEPARADPTGRVEQRAAILQRLNSKYELEPEDTSALVDLVTEEARVAAKTVVEQNLAAANKVQAEWNSVDQYMKDKFPESLQFADEVTLFVETNPEVQAEVAALVAADNRKGAVRHAWLAYKAEHPDTSATAQEQQLRAAEVVRQEEVDRARKDAGLISSQVSGVHQAAPAAASEEERQQAIRLYNAGVKEPWLRLAFGSQLQDPIFGE
jgi:hypothetical protein